MSLTSSDHTYRRKLVKAAMAAILSNPDKEFTELSVDAVANLAHQVANAVIEQEPNALESLCLNQ